MSLAFLITCGASLLSSLCLSGSCLRWMQDNVPAINWHIEVTRSDDQTCCAPEVKPVYLRRLSSVQLSERILELFFPVLKCCSEI